MGNNLRLGKIFGINIKINWSWLFIFTLVAWNLSTVFGDIHPQWGATQRLLVSLSAAFLFFLSVLAHELAHSLMARARGVPVKGITLFLFGGVSSIQRHPDSPLSEFLITIVGPLTSILLGIIFMVLSGVSLAAAGWQGMNPTQLASELGPVPTLLLWLGPINIILGVFNMIPGFPLDGGRVLRSILWRITDNLKTATRWASWVGQGIAWLMIISGVAMVFGASIPVFGSGFIDGLWLTFIGWFLNSAAVQSYQEIVVQDILEGVKVEDVMRKNPPTVNGQETIDTLVNQYIMQKDDHAFPVTEGNKLIGLITLSDVRSVPRQEWSETLVREAMTPRDKVVSVTRSQDASHAFNELSQKGVRQIPVLEDDQIVGVVRREEIVKWLRLHAESVNEGVFSLSPGIRRESGMRGAMQDIKNDDKN